MSRCVRGRCAACGVTRSPRYYSFVSEDFAPLLDESGRLLRRESVESVLLPPEGELCTNCYAVFRKRLAFVSNNQQSVRAFRRKFYPFCVETNRLSWIGVDRTPSSN